MVSVSQVIEQTIQGLYQDVVTMLPRLISAAVILAIGYVAIIAVVRTIRSSLSRVYPPEQVLIVDLIVTLLKIILWFTLLLTLLNVLGMGQIAASLGTATGFIALGISYALSDMIEDTVAGFYLLRDPDFNVGDRITSGAADGRIDSIGLRKSRIETDSETRVIVSNRQLESKWTLVEDASEP